MVRNFLKSRNLLTKEMVDIDYHMGLLNCKLDYFKQRVPELRGKNDDEVAKFLVEAYDKCNYSSPNYDAKFDEEMTRIGLQTDRFYGGAHNTGLTIGDNESPYGDMYDDYVDEMNDIRGR